ncbi:MAG TPA: cell division protein FtsH, partial [Solirubrobacteraceae bacterium]|nr:cell division protein FtsH [Solirubrobacteraceae bacterium]
FGHDHGQPFLGREFSSEPDYSDEIAREIDDEIRRIVESAHQVAKDMLSEHRDSLESISLLLLKRETIESEQFEALLAGKTEEEVFGPDDTPTGTGAAVDRPELPAGASDRPANPLLPRPGLAAEARGLDFPEKPELA